MNCVHIAFKQLGSRPKLEAIFRRIVESIHQFPLIWCQRKQMCTCLKRVYSLKRSTKKGIFCVPAFPVSSKYQKPGSEWGKPKLTPKYNETTFINPVSWTSYAQTLPDPSHPKLYPIHCTEFLVSLLMLQSLPNTSPFQGWEHLGKLRWNSIQSVTAISCKSAQQWDNISD